LLIQRQANESFCFIISPSPFSTYSGATKKGIIKFNNTCQQIVSVTITHSFTNFVQHDPRCGVTDFEVLFQFLG